MSNHRYRCPTWLVTLVPMSSTDLSELAWELASAGFAGRENAVRQVVRTSRTHGLDPVLVGILADAHQPEVARLRAFGRIAALLAAPAADAVSHAA
jgi:hypothetical protein